MSDFIISTEEYKAVCARITQLKDRQKELDRLRKEEAGTHPSFEDEKSYKKWCKNVFDETQSNAKKIKQLKELARIYEAQARVHDKNRPNNGLLILAQMEKSIIRGELINWPTPDEVEAERAAHSAEVQRLKTQIAGLQAELEATRRSKAPAAHMLARLVSEKQTEMEDWRLRRGYTHRIHLTAELLKEIDALL